MAELLDFQRINTKSELLNFLNEHREENAIYDSVMEKYLYEEELKKLIKRNKEIMFQLTQNTAINQTFNVEGFEKIETKLSSLDWSKIEKIKDKEEAEAILKY